MDLFYVEYNGGGKSGGRKYDGIYKAAIVVADIIGFSSSRLANSELLEIAMHNLSWMLKKSKARGFAIQTTGDGVFAAFPTPESGIWAALCIQDQLCGCLARHLHMEISIRIGISYGEVNVYWFEEQKHFNIRGEIVNETARLEAMADPDEILCTREMAEQLMQTKKHELEEVERTVRKNFRRNNIEYKLGDSYRCYKYINFVEPTLFVIL